MLDLVALYLTWAVITYLWIMITKVKPEKQTQHWVGTCIIYTCIMLVTNFDKFQPIFNLFQ